MSTDSDFRVLFPPTQRLFKNQSFHMNQNNCLSIKTKTKNTTFYCQILSHVLFCSWQMIRLLVCRSFWFLQYVHFLIESSQNYFDNDDGYSSHWFVLSWMFLDRDTTLLNLSFLGMIFSQVGWLPQIYFKMPHTFCFVAAVFQEQSMQKTHATVYNWCCNSYASEKSMKSLVQMT